MRSTLGESHPFHGYLLRLGKSLAAVVCAGGLALSGGCQGVIETSAGTKGMDPSGIGRTPTPSPPMECSDGPCPPGTLPPPPGGFMEDDPPTAALPIACTPGRLQAEPRLARLTHAEYDQTTEDLLGIPVQASADFLSDPTSGGFENSARSLVVSDRLGRDYRRAAEMLAELAVSDPTARAHILPCDPAGDPSACARMFVETFGTRAYRRPLRATEIDRYVELHAQGGDHYEGSAFDAGIRLVIEAMLQSPRFLYRVELSDLPGPDGLIPLDDYELASRLSYGLWGSMPDDELLSAAEAGQLHTPEQVTVHARRMLASPKAARVVRDFHRQWLQLGRYRDLSRDSELFPAFGPDLGRPMMQEVQHFVRHVILDENGSYANLLTAPYTFVNRQLAPLYGLSGEFGDAFEQVALDPVQRAGLLTQLGFLAANAYPRQTSPIHRGVFVQRQILCNHIPEPPGDADLNLPPVGDHIRTTRQAVELHTSPDACVGCHGMINPPGFAFEHYDAVGQVRERENGVAIDSSGQLSMDGAMASFDDGVSLAHQIAHSHQARACYAQNWLRFTYRRRETTADYCSVEQLASKLAEPDYTIQDMLVDMTRTRAFFFRAPEETE